MRVAGIDIIGISRAGEGTAIVLPQYDLCFDVAQGLPWSLDVKHYFVTHGHLDHAAGIPYIAAQKSLNKVAPPHFYVPQSIETPLKKIMSLWNEIEGFQTPFTLTPVSRDRLFPLTPIHSIRTFGCAHRIETYGYTLLRQVKKLKKEFLGLAGPEIVQLKGKGVEVAELREEPLLSFTGDTRIEVLLESPEIKKSQILIIECTYLDERKSIEHATKWGHLHLTQLLPHLSEIESEKIILCHFSRRYSHYEIRKLLNQRIPSHEKDRVIPLIPGAHYEV